MLNAKSVAMVAKELVFGVAAYNFVRGTMSYAAMALNLEPRRFSFSQALETINDYLPAFANADNDLAGSDPEDIDRVLDALDAAPGRHGVWR